MRLIRKITAISAVSFLLVGCFKNEAAEKLTKSLNDFFVSHNDVNAVYMVSQKNDVLTKGQNGVFNYEEKKLLSADNVMPIASGTKQMTAAVIMKLVEDSKLKLEEPVATYLPSESNIWPHNEVPLWATSVTIHDLLTHSSGLPEYIPTLKFDATTTHADIKKEIVKFACSGDMKTHKTYKYNNTGYVFLGLIIEHITGDTLENAFNKMLFSPLNMNNTKLLSWEEAIAAQTGKSNIYPQRYILIPKQDDATAAHNVEYKKVGGDFLLVPYSDGGLVSSVDDLIKWNQALHNGKVVSEQSYKLMTTPYFNVEEGEIPNVKVGYGMYIRLLESGQTAYYHNGMALSIRSENGYIPSDNIAYAILSNTMPPYLIDKRVQLKDVKDLDIFSLRESIFSTLFAKEDKSH